MKKNLLRVIAAVMFVCMTVAGAPIQDMHAEEIVTVENEENVLQDISVKEETEAADQEIVETDQIGTEEIHYVYIESPYLVAPDTQKVVFSLGSKYVEEQEFTITVQDSEGQTEEWTLSRRSDQLLLFEKTYTESWQTGTYQVVSLNIGSGEERKVVSVENIGVDARFGVNEEYDGYSELACVDGMTADTEDTAEVTVVTLDGLDEEEAETKIENALSEAERKEAESRMYGTSDEAIDEVHNYLAEAGAETRGNNIVVALDPGHDANDAGASYGGLKEETLTLKIANYCKEELEKYADVSVFMTRTSAACPYNCKSAGECLEKRAEAAAKAGAKIYVSIHLNASISSSAKGAEIIVPNYNWKPEVGVQGRALAEKILNELVALGLERRAIYSKNTTIGELYPDGSLSDYFTAHCCNKENGIPAIIVEHAFLTNSSDVNTFLRTEEGLKKLGVADANGIVKYFGLSKGRWETVGNKTFYYAGGQKVYGEKQINGEWYYFDPAQDGAMKTGWHKFPNKTVYYRTTGMMVHGEAAIDGKWYCFDTYTGAMITGWHQLPTKKVYYNTSGQMLYGEQCIDGKWYYFDTTTGAMKTGWHQFSRKKVYYNSNGCMVYGEQCVDGKWYYFDENTGAMKIGWHQLPTKKVYYNKNGQMVKGEAAIDGKWYYFDRVGAMKTGWVDLPTKRVYYSSTGAMLYGEQVIDGKIYYFDKSTGAMTTGWSTVNGKKVYYTPSGERVTGEQCIDGKWYCFDKSGCMIIGWHQLPAKKVYYDKNGQMVKGEAAIDGKWYYFDKVGAMRIGWVDLPTKRVYYSSTGAMAYGEQVINGKTYYFDKITGEWKTGWVTDNGKKMYYTTDGEKVIGEKCIDGKWYCFDKSGCMVTGWYQLPGKKVYYDKNGQMVKGEAAINGKWYYFDKVGAMRTGWVDLPAKRVYYDAAGAMVYGEQKIDNKWYCFDWSTGAMKRAVWVGRYFYTENGSRAETPIYEAAKAYAIMGPSNTTVDQMVRFYNKNKSVPYATEQYEKGGAKTIEDMANIFFVEAVKEGIRPEVAWAQTMLETNFLKFGNQVKIEQFNFAGLGATDNGAAGADFSSYGKEAVRMGVRAQIQHLKAYADPNASRITLAHSCVDPRFDHVDPKGSAPNMLYLGQKENPSGKGWATADEYGFNVYKFMLRLFES